MKETCGNCKYFEEGTETPQSGSCNIKRHIRMDPVYTVSKDMLCTIDSFSPSNKAIELERLDTEGRTYRIAKASFYAASALVISTIFLVLITGGYMYETKRMRNIMQRELQLRFYPSLYLVDDPKNIKEGEDIKTKIIFANGGPGTQRVKLMIVWVLDSVPVVDQGGFFADRGKVVRIHDMSFNMPPGKREIFHLRYPIKGKVKQLEIGILARFAIPLKEQYEYEIFTYQLKKTDSPLSGWDPTSDTRKNELVDLFKRNNEIRGFLLERQVNVFEP